MISLCEDCGRFAYGLREPYTIIIGLCEVCVWFAGAIDTYTVIGLFEVCVWFAGAIHPYSRFVGCLRELCVWFAGAIDTYNNFV